MIASGAGLLDTFLFSSADAMAGQLWKPVAPLHSLTDGGWSPFIVIVILFWTGTANEFKGFRLGNFHEEVQVDLM